ncbi:MAG: hypothetical protein WAV47_09565, partial [Blastocatellia bacterium]
VRYLAERVCKRLFGNKTRSPGMFESAIFHLKMRERLADRIRYCRRLALTTTVRDWSLLPLPRYLFFLYFALRPIRLAGKYGTKLLKRVFMI